MPRLLRRLMFSALAGAIAVAVAGGAWAGWLSLAGNTHTVVDGELYRSGQMSAAVLSDFIEGHDIRTVVNLEGAHPGRAWYDAERRAVEAGGARLLDFAWSAGREVSPAEVRDFLAAMQDAPKPLLIHCRAGADRTGLAVALYLAGLKGANEETAEAQLSFRYGHVGLPFTAAWPMDRTFEREEAGLGFTGS